MRSPAAQLLETALALHRAPGERFRLRERPLPPDLVHVMEVASGSPQALAVAAKDLGEEESTVLEAARFYLEQMLFAAPDADAYRILGVAPDANPDLIRTHHRWLQRWLHPDRAQAGDSAVYATRVNQAWATLRTPESRHQYDVRLAEARLAGASAPLPAATVRHWEHNELAPNGAGGRARYLVAAALAACIVLAVLVVRHEQGPQPWVPDAPDTRTATTASPATPPDDIEAVSQAFAAAIATPVQPTVEPPAPAAVKGPAEEPPIELATKPGADLAKKPAAELAKKPAVELAEVSPEKLAKMPAVEPAKMPAVELAKKPAVELAVKPAMDPHVGAAQAATPTNPAPPVEPTHGRLPPPVTAQPQVVEVAMTPTATPQPQENTTLLLARMELAKQRFSELTAYLAARPGAPTPTWSDPDTHSAADRVRQQMNVRGNVMFAPPNWQLHLDRARLNVDYQCPKCGVPKGRLDVHLVWRDGLWQVGGIDLAPAA